MKRCEIILIVLSSYNAVFIEFLLFFFKSQIPIETIKK